MSCSFFSRLLGYDMGKDGGVFVKEFLDCAFIREL